MADTVIDPLIADLIEWLLEAPRPYDEVMERWRTSCPRLTVWEDATDRGYVIREKAEGGSLLVKVTSGGQKFLAERRRMSTAVTAQS